MTPFADALRQKGWNKETDSNHCCMYEVAKEAAKTIELPGWMQDEQDPFQAMNIALYICAETAPRHNSDEAFVPYLSAYVEGNWQRQAAERLWQTSHLTTKEEAELWSQRADRAIERWLSQGH